MMGRLLPMPMTVGRRKTLTLLIPGIPEPLAVVKYNPDDSLANLRDELDRDLKQVSH